MCIAIIESLKFKDDLTVNMVADNLPQIEALTAKDKVFSVVCVNDSLHGGRMRWGQPIYRSGKKKWLRHATIERRFGFWAKWRATIVPVFSFIERDTVGNKSRFVEFQAEVPFWLGGLWTRDESGVANLVFLTQPAGPDVCPFHHRMPMSMHFTAAENWLNNGVVPEQPMSLNAVPRERF